MWSEFPRNSCLWKRWTYKQLTPNAHYAVCNNRDMKKVLEGHRGRIQGGLKEDMTFELVIKRSKNSPSRKEA